MANTTLNLRVNAQFDELAQLNAEAQRSRDKIAAMEQAAKILGKTVDNTDAAVEAHIKSLKTLQKNLDQNSTEYKRSQDELKRYQQNTRDAADSTEKFGGLLPNIGEQLKGLAAGIAAAFTIDAIRNFTQALVDQSLVIKNYAEGTGTSVENISRMATAAKKAGTDLNDLGDILKDINEKIAILQRGEGGEQELNLVRGLKQVGVELQNVDGSYRDAYDILVDYGKATQQLANDQELAKNATMVLENGNTQFLTSVQNLVEEQKKLPPLTKEQNDALVKFKQRQVDAGVAMEQIALQIMPPLLDAMTEYLMLLKSISAEGPKAFFRNPMEDMNEQFLKDLEYARTVNPKLYEDMLRKERVRLGTRGRGGDLRDVRIPAGQDPITGAPIGLPPAVKQALQPLAENLSSIQGLEAKLTALQSKLKNAATPDARAALLAQIDEIQVKITEFDGTAAKERDKLAEQAAQKRQQEAEKLAKSQAQYERDIFNLREGYERDVAKLRLDTLKQVQQLEVELQRQRRDAEANLADAVLRRGRAMEDVTLAMQLRSGKITQDEFDLRTEANRYERQAQDDILAFQQDRLNVQDQYLQNVQKINDLEMGHEEKLIELERKRVEALNNAAQKLTDQGAFTSDNITPSGDNTPGYSYTGAKNLSGRALSYGQVIELAMRAGFNKKDATIMAAIAMAESSLRPMAMNPDATTGDKSYGLWQINMLGAMGPERRRQFGLKENEDLYDPMTNARAAFGLFSGRGSFADWPTFTKGIYKRFMPDALRAAQQIGVGANTTIGVPVSLSPTGVSQFQQIFALASNFKFSQFNPSALAPGQFDYSNAQFGQVPTKQFANGLMYPNFSGFSPFQNPAIFGGGGIDFSRLQPYPGQIQGLGLQTAQMNLGTAQLSNRFGYTTDLTNPQTGELAVMQQEFDLAMRRFQLEQQFSQVAADRFLKVEQAARLEMQSLETANQTLQKEIESGTLDATALEVRRNEITLNNEKLGQLQQLPQLVLQESQAQQQLLEQKQMERQLQADIAGIISTNISQGIMNLIQGSQSLGEVLNNVVMNILNQMLQRLIEMVVQATIFQGIMAAFGGGGGLFGGLFSFLGFANGGVMSRHGAMQLQRYARGGIANSPQLAMFGEGSKPEAYVPLPDGRSIPVTIKGFANGGIYYPGTYGLFNDPFNFLRGIPDTEQSRRYSADTEYRDTVDKLIAEYIGIQYSSMMDAMLGGTNQHALQETLAKLREQQSSLFADEEFSRYLLDQQAETFFTGRNIGYLRTRYGLGEDESYSMAARLQQQYVYDRMNREFQHQNYLQQLIGGVYDLNYEPIQNRFAPNEFEKALSDSILHGTPYTFGQYASGGIARSPQLAMFGEGSLPEAFVPLPDGRTIPVSLRGATGGEQTNNVNNISVNVTAAGTTQQSDGTPTGDRLARAITRAVQEEIIKQQRPGGLLR